MVDNKTNSSRRTAGFSIILCSLVTVAILIFLSYTFFQPRWETNDDVGMSMVAHGYGLAAAGSPNLIFSNVLWGYLVRSIPEVNGVLGYSIATIAVLMIVGTVITYGLIQLGLGYLATISALVLILIRPVLFPQFTINAGLLMVAAIVCWHLFARDRNQRTLAIGCLLAFCSYLVRSQEFLIVLFAALPLLPWRILLTERAPKAVIFVLFSAIAVSALVDRQTYLGDEWSAFNQLNPVRAAITDFGAGESLRPRPDILERHGYSANDISLIQGWFFVDPEIASPPKLKAMLDELGPLPPPANLWSNAWKGVAALWSTILLPGVLAAMFLAFLRPSCSVAVCWGLCIVAVSVLGFIGRPGVLRVYVPLVSLLIIAPFIGDKLQFIRKENWHRWLEIGLLFFAAIFSTTLVISEAKESQLKSEQVRWSWQIFRANPWLYGEPPSLLKPHILFFVLRPR